MFSLEPIDSRMYCVIKGNQALVIYLCLSKEAIEFLLQKKLTSTIVLLTHENIDHILGVNMLRENFNCKIIWYEKSVQRAA